MKFCLKCQNMYYISINETDPNKLIHYCRNCGHTDDMIQEEGGCVLTTQLKTAQKSFRHMVNPYTKLDPTLPRIYNLPCPNAQCKTNLDINEKGHVSREVIYIRYDDDNLKYMYMCTVCDEVW